MLEEIKKLTNELISNEEVFADFCKKHYIPYEGKDTIEGGVAISEDRAILAYLQDKEGKQRMGYVSLKQENNEKPRMFILEANGTEYLEQKRRWQESRGEMGGFLTAQMSTVSKERLRKEMNLIQEKWLEAQNTKGMEGGDLSEEEIKEWLKGIVGELNRVHSIAEEKEQSAEKRKIWGDEENQK